MRRMFAVMLLTVFAAGAVYADGSPLPPVPPPIPPPCRAAGCGTGGGGGGGFVIVVPTAFGGAMTIAVPDSIAHRLHS